MCLNLAAVPLSAECGRGQPLKFLKGAPHGACIGKAGMFGNDPNGKIGIGQQLFCGADAIGNHGFKNCLPGAALIFVTEVIFADRKFPRNPVKADFLRKMLMNPVFDFTDFFG